MNALDIGAGGVFYDSPLLLQSLIHRPGNSVTPDDHLGARRDLREMGNFVNAHTLEPFHHMMVMDDGTIGHGGNAAVSCLLHHVHRTLDSGTEARSFRYFDSHTPSPRP